MYKKTFFIFILSALSLCSRAQTKEIVLKGKISTKENKPVPFAGIQDISSHTGVSADSNGLYVFHITLPATLRVSAIGFQPRVKTIAAGNADTLIANFVLTENGIELNAINITADHPPEQLIAADNLSDFELRNGMLWLLYNDNKSTRITIVDPAKAGTVAAESFLFPLSNLHKTENDFVYSIAGDSSFVFQQENPSVNYFSVALPVFQSEILAVVGYHFPCYYFMKEDSLGAKISYTCFDKRSGKRNTIYTYTDEKIYETNSGIYQSLSELGYSLRDNTVNAAAENSGALAADMNSAMNAQMITFDHVRNFTKMLRTIYCPLRSIRDSIYIFNFNIDTIFIFNSTNHFVRKMPLNFDLYGQRYENKNVLIDEARNNCYFKYVIKGITYLDKIDLDNGNKVSSVLFTGFPFIEKIRINEGFAYFSYYNATSGKRMIYRQNIE